MRVVKLIKEDCPIVLQFKITLIKVFINKVLEYTAGSNKRTKFVSIAMCSLVMSVCSYDLLVTSLLLQCIEWQLINSV